MSEHNEAKGVAFTDVWHPDGWKMSITARGDSTIGAGEELVNAVEYFKKEYGMSATYFDDPPSVQGRRVPAPEPASDPAEEFPFGPPEGSPEPVRDPRQAVVGRNLGLLDRKPKAGELKPGDIYEIKVDEFKRSSEAVKFYVSGLDFPIVVHGMEKEYPRQEFERIFQGWNPPEDDVRKPTPKGPFILMIEGSAKLNRNGNPWHNLVGARREGQASAATPPEDVPF